MEYFELTPKDEAYNVLGNLRSRINQIQRYKFEPYSEKSVDMDYITSKIVRFDPGITLPLIQGTLSLLDLILERRLELEETIKKSFTYHADNGLIEHESKRICAELIDELKGYKSSLSALEETLEIINISNSTDASVKLQWLIKLTLLADLFKILRRHKAINESKEGELTSFIASNFSVPKSPKISKGSLSSKMSGSLNDEKAITKFLNDLIKTASNM